MPNNYQQLNMEQAKQAIQEARNIVNQMKQSEQKNAMMAKQLANMEASNELGITQGTATPQMLAAREGQAAKQLQHLAEAEQNATQQLNQLEQIFSQLESQLR